jgi:hypothetical protein
MMMATDTPLPTEYYQLSRIYLETIKKDDGTSLPNISAFLKYIDQFEIKHKIEDDMQNTRIEILPEDIVEITEEEAHVQFDEQFHTPNVTEEPMFNSTEKQDNNEEVVNENEGNDQQPEINQYNQQNDGLAFPDGFRKSD